MKPTKEQLAEPVKYVPKVGNHLEATWGAKSYWCECVILPKDKIALLGNLNVVRNMSEMEDIEFRPIKTDREIFIENAAKIMVDAGDGVINDISLGALYDSGLFTLTKNDAE